MKNLIVILLALAWVQVGCQDELNDLVDPVISYRKINEKLAYNDPFEVDLNRDGKDDFSFASTLLIENGKSFLHLTVKAKGKNKMMLQLEPQLITNGLWAFPVERGRLISETPAPGCTWASNGTNGSIINISQEEHPVFGGLWKERRDSYLAVKIESLGREQYGWIRISHFAGEKEVTIHDSGLNLIDEQSVEAGEED